VKSGGGLRYVTGPMGAGKTLNGTRRILATVMSGRYAITNVELTGEWWKVASRHDMTCWSARSRRKAEDLYRRCYVFQPDLAEARRYRVPGTGEARAVFVWDETHNDLNNRKYKDDGRGEILEWATQLRKLGFAGFLLSQSHENTDAQLRRICNYIIRLQNQRDSVRLLGMRITPWPLFLAVWMPSNVPLVSKSKPAAVERYFLTWHRHCYDTMGLFHGLSLTDSEGEDSGIHLPDPRRTAPAPKDGAAGVVGSGSSDPAVTVST